MARSPSSRSPPPRGSSMRYARGRSPRARLTRGRSTSRGRSPKHHDSARRRSIERPRRTNPQGGRPNGGGGGRGRGKAQTPRSGRKGNKTPQNGRNQSIGRKRRRRGGRGNLPPLSGANRQPVTSMRMRMDDYTHSRTGRTGRSNHADRGNEMGHAVARARKEASTRTKDTFWTKKLLDAEAATSTSSRRWVHNGFKELYREELGYSEMEEVSDEDREQGRSRENGHKVRDKFARTKDSPRARSPKSTRKRSKSPRGRHSKSPKQMRRKVSPQRHGRRSSPMGSSPRKARSPQKRTLNNKRSYSKSPTTSTSSFTSSSSLSRSYSRSYSSYSRSSSSSSSSSYSSSSSISSIPSFRHKKSYSKSPSRSPVRPRAKAKPENVPTRHTKALHEPKKKIISKTVKIRSSDSFTKKPKPKTRPDGSSLIVHRKRQLSVEPIEISPDPSPVKNYPKNPLQVINKNVSVENHKKPTTLNKEHFIGAKTILQSEGEETVSESSSEDESDQPKMTLSARFGKLAQLSSQRQEYEGVRMKIVREGGQDKKVYLEGGSVQASRSPSPRKNRSGHEKWLREHKDEYDEYTRRYGEFRQWDPHRDLPRKMPPNWDDINVRYTYYKESGYFGERAISMEDYLKWEEWWYRYKDWLEKFGDNHEMDEWKPTAPIIYESRIPTNTRWTRHAPTREKTRKRRRYQ